MLDAASLGGADHKTPLFQSAAFASGASEAEMATWAEADGARWVVVSSKGPGGGIQAFKVADANGAISVAPGWTSHDISGAASPIVVNGVLFALAGGSASSPAVLHALEGTTGKALWNSGSTITSFVDSGRLSAGDGQVYVPAHDNTLYAFGIPLEH